jgi:phosphate ABC transporter phosphate-binding protein
VKPNRSGAALSLLAASALVLAACGSNSNSSSPSSAAAGGATASSGAAAAQVSCGGKKTLKASGSTAQANAMTRFVNAYEQSCSGYTLNYTANGSGAGISEFTGNQTDLGGSDSPLAPSKGEPDAAAKRCGSPAWDLPTVFGPIAITYNINGVTSLNLDGPTAAKIFNGTIKTWDDPAIKALNANTNLPSTPIHVVFRNDQSGTTDNFQQYLIGASDGAWGKPAGKTFNGGIGEGAKGNDGTSAAIKNTDGSITYNEWSFAQAQKLNMANIVTSPGTDPVTISADSVGKTIAGATIKGQGNDLVIDTTSFYKPSQAGSYPIVLATYEIVCSKYPDSATGQAVKAFLQAALGPGQNGLADNGYIPVPAAFQSKLSTAVNAIA